MRVLAILTFAAVAGALVIPEDGVLERVVTDSCRAPRSCADKADQVIEQLLDGLPSAVSDAGDAFGAAIEHVSESFYERRDAASKKLDDGRLALQAMTLGNEDLVHLGEELEHAVPRTFPWWGKTKKPRSPRKPRKPHHGHRRPNKTVYELIANSKYTTKLAALISESEDLVNLLNGTSANFTVFAPTNRAFEKIPKHAPKPSKEDLKRILAYHVSGEFFPAGKLLTSPTIPTLLEGANLSTKPKKNPQRLSWKLGLRGLTINFLSRVVAIDIFGTNGVIHGVDSFIVPPWKAAEIIEFVPGDFSTLELGLQKTGLFAAINDTSTHLGGTLFAPSNLAFKKLGYKINGFLFSKWGEKYLKALLKYHVVANQTLYTDAFYPSSNSEDAVGIPKGKFHIDLPTLLKDRPLSIDIARFGALVDFRINGFTGLAASNIIAKDGVVHAVSSVLIPPKKVPGHLEAWSGQELTEDDLRERLEPLLDTEDVQEEIFDWEL